MARSCHETGEVVKDLTWTLQNLGNPGKIEFFSNRFGDRLLFSPEVAYLYTGGDRLERKVFVSA
jgi:hypothetical protein